MASPVVNWITQDSSFNATPGDNLLQNIVVDTNGNSYICYITSGGEVSGSGNTSTSSNDIVVAKVNYYGYFQWAKQLSSFNVSFSTFSYPSIAVDSSNNVYVSYYSSVSGVIPGSGNTNLGLFDIVVFKLDSDGNNLWSVQQPTFNTTSLDYFPSIATSTNGFVYVAYQTTGLVDGSGNTFTGSSDIVVFKLDVNGTFIWAKELSSFNTTFTDSNASIAVDSNNDVIVVAYTTGLLPGSGNTYSGSEDVYIFKLDGVNGTNLWTVQNNLFNSSGSETVETNRSIGVDSNDNIYISYKTNGTIPGPDNLFVGGNDIVVTKFNSSGNHLWSKQTTQFDTTSIEDKVAMSVTSSGNIFLAYNTLGTVEGQTNTGGNDVVVMKMDTNGNMLWVIQNDTFNTTSQNLAPYISHYNDEECFVTFDTIGKIDNPGTYPYAQITVFKLVEIPQVTIKTSWITQSSSFNAPNVSGGNIHPSITVDTNGNTYICYVVGGGVISGSGNTLTDTYDIAVFKLNYFGFVQWTKQLSTFNASISTSTSPAITIDTSGNLYITYFSGYGGVVSGNTNTGSDDIVVFKLDSNGNNLWSVQQPTFNSPDNELYPSIAVSTNGYVYIAYVTTGYIPYSGNTFMGTTDIAVLKLDVNGTFVWAKELSSFNTIDSDYIPSIAVNSNNDVIVVAQTGGLLPGSGNTASGSNDIYIFKLDGVSGANIWTIQKSSFNTSGSDSLELNRNIGIDSSDNIYISYKSNGTMSGPNFNAGFFDAIVTKFDSSGNHIWSRQSAQFDTTSFESYTSISVTPSGNIFLTYNTDGTTPGQMNTGGRDVVVTKMNTDGAVLWINQNSTFNTNQNNNQPYIANYGEKECFVTYYTSGNILNSATAFTDSQITVFKLAEITQVTIPTNIKWIRQLSDFNSALPDLRPQISADASNNCYTCFYSVDTGVTNVVITKLDKNGNFIWKKSDLTINSASGIQSYPAISTNPNGYSYVAYMTNSLITGSGNSLSGSYDICVACIDKNANTIYAREFPIFNTALDDQKPSVAIDKLKNCYVCYYTNGQVQNGTSSGGQDIVIFKLDKNGNFVWSRQLSSFNTSSDETYPVIGVDEESNCYIAYNTTGTTSGNANTGGTDVAIVKLDKNGVQQWCIQSSSFNTTSPNLYPSIAVNDSGKFYMVYYTLGTISGGSSTGNYDIVVTKFDKNGNLLWIKQSSLFNTTLVDEYPTVATNFCENCYVSYMTNTNGVFEIYFFQLDKNGNYVSSGLVTTYGPTNLALEADNYYPSIAVASNGQQFITFYTFGLATQDAGNTQSGQEDVVVFSVF